MTIGADNVVITTSRKATNPYRVDTADGVSHHANPSLAAEMAADLLGAIPYVQNVAIYHAVRRHIDLGAELISVDECSINGRVAFDIHATRGGVLVEAVTIDYSGATIAIL